MVLLEVILPLVASLRAALLRATQQLVYQRQSLKQLAEVAELIANLLACRQWPLLGLPLRQQLEPGLAEEVEF